MAEISKNTTIGELLTVFPEAAPILMEIGMQWSMESMQICS